MELIDKSAAYNALIYKADQYELSFTVEAFEKAARIIDQMPIIEFESIPLKVLEMAILMVNVGDQCDQAGQWVIEHRRACQHILDWYNSNDYKITCKKAGIKL